MGAYSGGFTGWLANPGRPFSGAVFIPYEQRSLILIGANGYGKTRLLNSIVDPATPRVFAKLPPRLAPYLTVARSRSESDVAPEGPVDITRLFEEGEAARPAGDEHQWWADRLGLIDVRWIVRWSGPHEPATISAAAAEDLLGAPAVTIRAAPRHVADTLERWTMPDADSPGSLAEATEDAFRAWASHVLIAAGRHYHVSANPLIAVGSQDTSVSLLSLAARFAAELANRTTSRLALLVGLTVELRSLPAERFSWQFKTDEEWLPLEWASRAVSRWASLTARETLRELEQYAAAADSPADLDAVLRGNLDSALIPPGDARPFASQSSWVALDEPEVHLFASESRRLGEVLAGHGRAGRTVIATHSLDLAAQFVGNASFVMFDGPGRFSIGRPADGLANLLRRLTKSGPGILAGTRVLYVEGDWDVELIELLYGNVLARHNILLSPMHGVKGASLAASSVWQRMMPTPFGMMFDALKADDVAERWAKLRDTVASGARSRALHSLRLQIKAARGRPYEEVELLRLFTAVVEGGLEDRLHLVMHGLSDIFQVMHPSLFGLPHASWSAAGFDGTRSFKDFLRQRDGVDLKDGNVCRQKVKAFVAADRPVDAESEQKLGDALRAFAEDPSLQPVVR
jgi:hypothetical protein